MNKFRSCSELFATLQKFEKTNKAIYMKYRQHQFDENKVLYSVLNLSKDVEYECPKTEESINIKGRFKFGLACTIGRDEKYPNYGIVVYNKCFYKEINLGLCALIIDATKKGMHIKIFY